jgi:TonB-linked SusC/RagA family outer membrane protein
MKLNNKTWFLIQRKDAGKFLNIMKIALLLFILSSIQLFGSGNNQQMTTITGKIVDENDQPLPGVNVVQKGTLNGTTTDIEGNYLINVPLENVTLVFTAVGYNTIEKPVDGQKKIDLKMEVDVESLNEVVVIGYGAVTKRELTGAVSSVKEGDFNPGAVTNALELVQGKIAGLSVTKVDGGDPTKGYEITLRGSTSINGSTSPLVVIDGIPGGSLDAIAPGDIESVDVLKDGSAAAIYGSRGTNGVILVTTKKGKKGALQVEFNSQYYTERVSNRLEVLNRDQYLQMKERFTTSKDRKIQKIGASMIDYGGNTDWFDQIIQKPFSHNQHLSLSAGSDKTNYRLSFDYTEQEGILLNSDKNELRVSYNMQQKALNDHMVFNVQLGMTDSKSNPVDYNAVRQTLQRNPTESVYNEDGSLTEFIGAWQYENPVGILTERVRDDASSRLFGNLGMDVYLTKSLKFSATGGLNISRALNGYYSPSYSNPSETAGVDGTANRYSEARKTSTFESILEYKKSLKKHSFTLLGGYAYEYYVEEGFFAENSNFITDYVLYNNLGLGTFLQDGRATMSSFKNESILAGFFARGAYNYDNKLFLSASIRREGSSKFGDNNKWGTFPAVSLAWDITQESFMKGLPVINFLKLRVGYGVTGNQGLNEFYIPLVRYKAEGEFYYNGELIRGYGPISNENKDLKWETKTEYNLGIDWMILNSRLGGSIDLYSRITSDLLEEYDVPMPPKLYPKMWANVATMSSSGVEFTINAIPVKSEKFNWNFNLTLDFRKSKVLSIQNDYYKLEYRNIGDVGAPGISAWTHRLEEGQPLGNIHTYRFESIDSLGKWVFADLDSIKGKSTGDRTIVGNGIPDFYLGLTNTFQYGNFDLSIMLRGMFGHQIINAKRIWHGNPKFLPRNVLVEALETNLWDEPEFSSYYVEDGDFVKVDNITLGYNIPFKDKKWLKSIRIYATCNNAFVFTKYTGLDPEVSFKGLEPGNDNRFDYPTTRTFLAGINVKF